MKLTGFILFTNLLNPSSNALATDNSIDFSNVFHEASPATRFSASSAPYQLEVLSTVSPQGTLLNAWTESSDSGGMKCGFSASQDGGRTWAPANVHRATGFEIGANPAIAADAQGRLYAVCMSLNGRFSSGVLDLSISEDSGKTWSPWRIIYASNPGGPDKPSMVAGIEIW